MFVYKGFFYLELTENVCDAGLIRILLIIPNHFGSIMSFEHFLEKVLIGLCFGKKLSSIEAFLIEYASGSIRSS